MDVVALAELLEETGRAHHEAFIASNGADPEWPMWYAEYLQPRIVAMGEAELTRSELIYLLVAAARSLADDGEEGWAHAYASFIATQLS